MSYMVLEKVEKVFSTLEDARKYAEENASTNIELVVAKKLGTVKIKTVFEADKKIKAVTEKKPKKVNVESVNKIEAVESTVLENEPIVLFDNDYSVKSNAPETIAYTDNFGFLESSNKIISKVDLGTDNLDMHNENLSKKVFTSVLAKKTDLTPVLKKDISTELNTRLSKELKDEFYTQDEIINELMTDKPIKAENKTPVSDDNIELVISQELPVNLSDDSLVLPQAVEMAEKEFFDALENVTITIENNEDIDDATQVLLQDQAFNEEKIEATETINLKQICESKFTEALKKGRTGLNLRGAEIKLLNAYPELQKEEWFHKMIVENLKQFSQKEDDSYCESKQLDELILIENKEEFLNWLDKFNFLASKPRFKINIDKKKKHFGIEIETTPETIEPVKENKATETSEEKTFLCDIGPTNFPMLEKNVKKQVETKFTEAINSNAPMERMKAEKETLINWYKKDQLNNLDWFQNMYTAYLAKASKKELELATNKPEKNVTGEELFQLFESEVNQAQKEQDVFSIAKLDKYKELESLDKARLDSIIDTKIYEIIVRNLINNIATCVDPEMILKGYSKETLKDQRVKDAIEARKKADIEKLQKLHGVKKEVQAIQEKHNSADEVKKLTGVELAIKEIKEATKETFSVITNKHKEYYLVNNEYYEAVKTKEKSFNIDLFNELLEEIKDKSDIEVLRITSQVKYTYLANILKEEWDKNIAPIITRALVKELCDELIKTPITKQKELLNKYSKEIQEHPETSETISDINTKF